VPLHADCHPRHGGERAGVWTESGKIAAAGVRATRWISYHGIALNVCPDMSHFEHIVPCGITGRPVTSVEHCLQGADHGGHWPRNKGQELLAEYSAAIVEAVQNIFELDVQEVLSQLQVPVSLQKL
jgi:lipoate-protein ligase B